MATVNNTASTKVAYSYLQSKNKISGLVSGMDIDSIMEKLMKAESAQMEKLQQQKQKYEWKRDAYREVNTKLNTFQQDLFDKYTLKSSWNSKSVSTTSNNSISVKATASANGNLTVSQVTKATSASKSYIAGSAAYEKITATTEIQDIEGLNATSLKIFDEDASSVQDVLDSLKANGYAASITSGQLKITSGSDAKLFDSDTQQSLEKLGFKFTATSQTSEKLKDSNGVNITTSTKLIDVKNSSDVNFNLSNLKINDQEINIDANEDSTVGDIIKEIKNQGFNASLKDGKLMISTSDGSDVKIESKDATAVPEFASTLSESTGNTFVTQSSSLNGVLKGTNTIQEILGPNAEDSMFTIRAVQSDGTTKDTTIIYKATDTIASLMSKINSSGAGVTAIFNDGQFNISANNTGQRNGDVNAPEISILSSVTDEDGLEVSITDSTHQLFSKLMSGDKTSLNDAAEVYLTSDGSIEYSLVDGGSKASITVNGVNYEQNSNVFNVAGYEIIANNNLASGAGDISITSTLDTDKAIDKVKEFVTMYNDLLKDLNDRTTEKKKVGYDPLTDAQKAEMTDSEIEKWEKAAKEGLLKGDTTLNTVLSSMRQTIFNYGNSIGVSKVQGSQGDTLSSIGITTSSTWSDNGKLEIDEEKLRAAIEKDPDILSRIFTGDGTDENPGIVSQLRSTAQSAVKTIEKSAGKESVAENQYSLGKTISSLTTKIDDWKDRLKDIEERYWNQFSAMEKAIQKANSQSSIFSAS